MEPRQSTATQARRETRDESLARVKAVIDADPAAPYRMATLARCALMGQWYFQHAFESRYGVSPGRYVRLQRLRVACDLLESTDYLMARISGEVGYANQSSFTNIFVREFGLSPTAYRRWVRYAAELGTPTP